MAHQIFLSYASPDRTTVEHFYEALLGYGFNPWMDSQNLTAGQNWDFEIQRALDQSSVIVVFLSSNSVGRRGYVQREIRLALKKLEEKLVDDVFIIPVSLEDVERPRELAGIHFLDASQASAFEDLRIAVSQQLSRLGAFEGDVRSENDIQYRTRKYSDVYEGIPGFDINADYIDIDSKKFISVKDASLHINGNLADLVMSARQTVTEADTVRFHLSQETWARTNTLDLIFGELTTVGRTLSVSYTIHTYSAGAAHPVSGHLTYNFFMSPMTRIATLESLFESDESLSYIQERVRTSLAATLLEVSGSEPDFNWISQGTCDWNDLNRFTFRDGNLLIHFGSYQVAAYAYGHQRLPFHLPKWHGS